jgi:hypothetical protein
MGDFEKVNDVAAADIEKVNDIAKSSIQNINGVDTPSSGQVATRWVAAFDGVGNDWYIAYAAHSDRTSWTGTTVDTSNPDTYWLAYGKDGSGNALWAAVTQSAAMEITHDGNNDITDGSTWTRVSDDSAGNDLEKCFTIAWGNDVWIAAGIVGSAKEVYRSTDGASWAAIDVSGVSGIGTQTIYGLASDGAGNWMFGQNNKIFASTDNGSSWTEMTSYPGTAVADVGFTNSTWVVLGAASPGNVNTVGAAAFATEMGGGSAATWGEQDTKVSEAGTTHGTHQLNLGQTGAGRSRLACGGGVVIIGHTEYTMALDVNGTTVGIRASGIVGVGGGTTINGTMNTIATDGNGVWLLGSDGGGDGGEVAESTDNGANWSRILDNFTFGSGTTARKFEAIRANVYLPV